MAIKATLYLKFVEKGYNLNECEYLFYQPTDINNKPNANPKGGIIKFTIDALSDDDLTFHKWMFDKTEAKSGSIVFELQDNSKKGLSFNQAYCIGLHESFSKNSTPPKTLLDELKNIANEVQGGAGTGGVGGPWGTGIGAGIGAIIGIYNALTGTSGDSSQMLTTVILSATQISFVTEKFVNNELLR